MKAVRIHQYGSLEQVALEEIATPRIAADEVLVRLEAASVNPLDLKLISGHMQAYFPLTLPYTAGTDLAGTVVEAGALASPWQPGDRVFARLEPGPGEGPEFSRGGAFAGLVAVPAKHLAAAPKSLELTSAAGLPTAAGTAWQALFEIAQLTAGQSVLIHAGAGGVGSFAVQLAKRAGARVFATASAGNAALVRKLGADEVIDHRTDQFEERVGDLDLVLDTIGGEVQLRSYQVLKKGGQLVTLTMPPDQELASQHGVTARWFGHTSSAARLALLAGLCDEGALRVVIDSTHPLTDIRAALERSASGRARGKILLTDT
ncbi:MAG: NADPH:quinone oxidoreductase [Akkermansiaceae bacterium]|nr:NADPH:quinone oxidoreductase [Akkermansiaceae bacterium]